MNATAPLLLLAALVGFAANEPGAPYAEFRRPPEGRERLPVLPPVAADGAGKPLTTPQAWRPQREALARRWREIIGPFPERVPLEPKVLSTEELPDHTRILVRYQ